MSPASKKTSETTDRSTTRAVKKTRTRRTKKRSGDSFCVALCSYPWSMAGVFLIGFLAALLILLVLVPGITPSLLSKVGVQWESSAADIPSFSVEEEIDRVHAVFPAVKSQDFSDVDLQDFWEAWSVIESAYVPRPIQYANDVDRVRTQQRNGFPVGERPDRDDFLHAAIQGLASATRDRYTNFFPPDDAQRFKEEILDGEIDGVIGAYIHIVDTDLVIADTIEGGPAAYAGLQKDDVILEIDGVDSTTYTLDDAIHAIRGPRGTPVVLRIYRQSEEDTFDLTLLRDRVDIPTVETEIQDNIFVIRLLTFTKKTPEVMRDAIREFQEHRRSGGENKLLLDVRGNSGGLLSVAVRVAGLFLHDTSVVLYEYTGTDTLRVYRVKRSPLESVQPTVTILVDGRTASASEILAETLRYHGVADVVGLKTVGKGSVQMLRHVGKDGAFLKITTAHWLTPDRKIIAEDGITPDVDFDEELQERLRDDPSLDADAYMLERAIAHLRAR